MMSTLTVNKEAIDKALTPEMLATDIAYFLVRKGWGLKNYWFLASSQGVVIMS